MRARLIRAAVLAAALGCLAPASAASAAASTEALPKINNVFVIVLENENAADTFGPASPAPYLAQELPAKGALVPNYYAIGHLSLDNYVAMVSGQAPNVLTQADCIFYSDFIPGIPTADGQVLGTGCVYPAPAVQTVANQLEDSGLSWKGYMEDMAAKAPQEPASCRHPSVGSFDNTQSAEVGDQYAARHNPFVYFHSIIDSPTCQQNDVDLSELGGDLEQRGTTANYNFISPNLCNDGHDEPCIDGQPGGLAQADGWLRANLPPILDSPAYKRHGLVIITFDEAESGGAEADSSACCAEPAGPNTPSPGGPTPGPGGGRVGAVMLSPCIRSGTVSESDYNHYSMLRSIEDNFSLPHLGYAGQEGLQPFGTDIFNRPDCREKMHLRARPRKATSGSRQTFRFSVRSTYARCRRGVEVKLIDPSHPGRPKGAGRRARTKRNGKAEINTFLRKPGLLRARVNKKGCVTDSVPIRVR
ncbi:MAG: phosphoesterase [Solirubrobacterales bacterium]|nr:phosphoesterase [Solirubrobacterales bacterium]